MSRCSIRQAVAHGALALVFASALTALAQAPDPSQARAQVSTPAAPPSRRLPLLDQLERELIDSGRAIDDDAYRLDLLDAWIRLGEAREADLRAGRAVALPEGRRAIFMSRAAFNQSLLRHATQVIVDEAARPDKDDHRGGPGVLGLAASADLLKEMVRSLERDALRESEAYRQSLLADLAHMRRQRDALSQQLADARIRLQEIRDILLSVELSEATLSNRALGPSPPGRVTSYPMGLAEAKAQLGKNLEEIRLAGRWSADNHYKIGTLIGIAKTMPQLDLAGVLMMDYADCHTSRNTLQAVVAANARAGQYRTPGDRIGELNRIANEFSACIAGADLQFQQARGR